MDGDQARANTGALRLAAGTVLDGVYIVDEVIGAGGFGVTYKCRDQKLGVVVAIKEYFPADIGSRDGTMSVHPITAGLEEIFKWGRDGFIAEAQMLAGFRHPNIVGVMRFFEANNTAYMVLHYEAGPSLSTWLAQLGRPPSEAELEAIVQGLAGALAAIHERRLIHRDIAPDNIIIRADGSPVLLDFGAARYEVAAKSRLTDATIVTKSSYVIGKRHYSPIEQLSGDVRLRGPWSDIYAFCATLYRAVTGSPPPDAKDRVIAEPDPLAPALMAAKGDFSLALLSAIDRGLRLKPQERPQSIQEFMRLKAAGGAAALDVRPIPELVSERKARTGKPTTFGDLVDHRQRPPGHAAPSAIPRLAAAFALVAALTGLGWFLTRAPRPGPIPPIAAPNPSIPAPSRAAWNQQQQTLDAELKQLRLAAGGLKSVVERQQWPSVSRQAGDAVALARRLGAAAAGLLADAQTATERGIADAYRQDIGILQSTVLSARNAADEAQSRQGDAVRERVTRFIEERYLGIKSPQTFDFTKNYTAVVDYFGRSRAAHDIAREKRDYFTQWPSSSYALRQGTLTVNTAGDSQKAVFEYIYRLDNGREERSGRGSTQLTLTEKSAGEFLISAEAGSVLSRDIRPLAPLALAAPVIPAFPLPDATTEPPPATRPAGPSLWSHNGSMVRLEASGDSRRFIYKAPRQALLDIGVQPGTLLFNGVKSGDIYSGIARIFVKNCSTLTYQVIGEVASDQRRVEMRGTRPHVDSQCQLVSRSEDILVFEFVRLDEAAEAPLPVVAGGTISQGGLGQINRQRSRFFSGDGYLKRASSTFAECERLCLADPRCRALELHRRGSTCSLYDRIPESGTADDAEIGIKVGRRSEAPARAPQVATWTSGDFEIQVGAFSSEELARQKLQEVREVVGGLLSRANTVLRPLSQPDRVLYRARFVGFDQGAAQSACAELERRQIPCFVTDKR